MGQLGGVGNDMVVLLGGGGLEVAEAQLLGKLPDLLQAFFRRAGIGREDQGRLLEQLREGEGISGPLDARHGVPADEVESAVPDHALQGGADHALHAAAVHHHAALAEVVPVLGDIGHRGLRVQGDDDQIALRQVLRRKGGGDHALVQRPAEDRAVGVVAIEGAVRICVDGLGHAAADEAQAHHADCFNHKELPASCDVVKERSA